MLWSVINEGDVFLSADELNDSSAAVCNCRRSSNPYDYLRNGYYLDNAVMFGGKNIVNTNCRFPGYSSGADLRFPDIGKRALSNIP